MAPSDELTPGCRGIFISYARDDDEVFAKELWRYLETQGVYVWWDREAMESRGLTFLQEIRDAISSVERLLLIVGPRPRHKPYVEVEWRHALREGAIVTPLLRLGEYDDVPEALRSLPLKGDRGQRVTDRNSEEVLDFRWSPDGKSLAILSGHSDSDVVLLLESEH